MLDINNQIRNKVLLITGGTGSFGSTVLRHFLSTGQLKVFNIKDNISSRVEMLIFGFINGMSCLL